MKKLYLKKKEQFLEWFSFRYHKTIINLYARVQTRFKKPFVISVNEVPKKKGGTKYSILFIETQLGVYKFWTLNGKIKMDQHPAFLQTKESKLIDYSKK